jgi:bifunctional UDP-N-acetylglucosamine pyrophosphorylase/glucosamine-1-phosphate N-acetyltransferase
MGMSDISKNATAPGAVDVVIMAAGKGTRMKSKLPKVLHLLAGRALLRHVVDTAAELSARQVIVITGHGAAEVEAALAGQSGGAGRFDLDFVRQELQLGTGHAVQQVLPVLRDDGVVVILSGDVPLIRADTLRQLIAACGDSKLALLTIDLADPTGYGRIQRRGQAVQAIVEQKDATAEQRAINEVYSGMMALPARQLKQWLARLDRNNAQGEYYLTDIVKFAVADGVEVVAHKISDALQVAGVNSPLQLAELERACQRRTALQLMEQGVRLADPARLDVRGSLQCGQDVSIDVNCVFEGQVTLADDVRIGANCVISNASMGAGAVIHAFSHIEGGAPGSKDFIELGAEVHIGNFVEVKNSSLARGAKANHLAYLGDTTVGERVNFGAGSITANYDGANKHRTVIEADVHIGSNCVLIAPLTVGAGGTVGGGSTLSKDTPPGALSVARARQVSIPNWKRPKKAK